MFNSNYLLLLSSLSLPLGFATSALAQADTSQDKPSQKDEHEIEKLVITSNPLNRTILQSATPVSIIAGEDLESRVAPTLGETLKNVPGVHSTYFGPVSSSPIIRGLDGPRIRVLQNGLDVSDASRIGPDHVVSTETANASQIEVLRGPATLLYGSGAIGGVVNVVDNRLPTREMDELQGKVSYLHDSVSSEDLINLSLDAGHQQWLFHLDAFDRSTENYEIPGPAQLGGSDTSGILDNSFIAAHGFSSGIGWAKNNLNLAVSIGSLQSEYGVPGHAHEEEHEEEEEHQEELHAQEMAESIYGRLKQDRYQVLADWTDLDGFISEVRFRSAFTDYTHSEIEDGEVGTTFTNETLESRFWAKHAPQQGWEGVLGFNYLASDFSALGDEAFTPASESRSFAVFALEEKPFGAFLWQLGARVEKTQITVDNDFFVTTEQANSFEFDQQSFTGVSLSAGSVWTVSDTDTLSFNYAYSQRAPSAAEIFSNGLHIATNTYELGVGFDVIPGEDNDEFEIIKNARTIELETSNNIDLTYHYTGDQVEATFSLFYNQINDYLFQQNTGLVFVEEHHDEAEEHGHELEEGLPVFVFQQQDADIYGFEAEVDWHFNDSVRLETFADSTRATLQDGQNVPRIPPLRIGAELHWENTHWHAELGATYYAKQDDIAEFETLTQGYTLVNAAFSYYMDVADNELVLFVRGNNLTNEEARVHASFIKDDAPLPGRSIVVGARLQF
ncbi:TonB-dependent receptor [Aliiglaciecola litoralis]|uniref:TonB-dependent receptor n=1 Tax=Aliiglaciecola litoralis TaxID=582857 RepID=A0ABN1LP40_9ALTE